MIARRHLALLLAFLSSLHRKGSCCDHITETEVFPSSISLSLSYAEIRCNHDSTVSFVSFYTPSDLTLTHNNLPKHEIVEYTDYDALFVHTIEQTDIGVYQCNYRDAHGNQCVKRINLALDVNFCTSDGVSYHQYLGESVTLQCCVENQVNQYWTREGSSEVIAAGDNVEITGNHLTIRSVSLEDEGQYRCVAVRGDEVTKTISATLKVYERLSISVDPAQKVVNVSDRAELNCTAHSYPLPTIVWTREDRTELEIESGVIGRTTGMINSTASWSVLTFYSVTDEVTGTYRCTGVSSNATLSAVSSLQLFGTPSAPLEVTVSIADRINVNITWKPPLDDGHLQLLHYLIMWFRMGTGGDILERDSDTVNGSTTSYIIRDLNPVTNYTVTLYAINRRGKGMGSKDRNIVTLSSVPGSLSYLTSFQLTASSVHIEFTIPADDGGSPITRLQISLQPGDGEISSEIIDIPDAIPLQKRSHKLQELEGDTAYTVRVSVGNVVGFGPEREAFFKTLRPGYPATPTSVRATGEVGAESVTLSWEVVDVGKPSTEYLIQALKDGEGGEGEVFVVKPDQVKVDGTRESTELSELEPGTCYRFEVTVRNEEGLGLPSLPSNLTCTLSCQQDPCNGEVVDGVQAKEDRAPSNAQLIPILVVTIVVAMVVVLVVVLVAILSRRASARRKSAALLSSHNHSFATSSSSSQFSSTVDRSVSSVTSSLAFTHQLSQVSQNSSSGTDPDEAPPTSSSIVSDNPFYFGASQVQNGSPQYQNRPSQYENGISSSGGLPAEFPQQLGNGAKTTGSYPLFPIPEHRVAMGGHFENSAPVIPIRAPDGTVMTNNPAFKKPQNLPMASPHSLPQIIEDTTPPPPIPPYRRNSFSDVDHTHPQLHHIHVHQAQGSQPPIPPRSHSTNSFPFLGESFSQTTQSPVMPRSAFFVPDEEEDEVEFTDNDAYEKATPPRALPRDPPPLPDKSRPSYTNLSVSSLPRGRSASPVLPRRGSAQSTESEGNEGAPRFEISRQQEQERRGRRLVFETVTIKSHV